jgi:predicted RecB family nuclease
MDSKPHSPSALASHLSCAHFTQLERKRHAGTLEIEFRTDPRVEALQVRGQEHEDRYVERLKADGRTVRDLRETRDPAATIAAMREGIDAIVQAPLQNDRFFGIADVLLRCKKPSALGAYSYEPVDTKLSRETRGTTILQLATYCDLLATAQGEEPDYFHVVTPIGEETYRLADFAAFYRLAKGQFEWAAAVMPAPATYPDPVEHCGVCKYWKHCDDQRRADDHPSLIAGIRSGQVEEFQSQGIARLTDIAAVEGALPNAPRRGRRESYVALGRQAHLQVEARSIAPPPLEFLPLEPGRGLARLPEASPGDVFLDFEGDPFVGEKGLEYLTGFHVRDAKGNVVLNQVWALDAAAEKVACEQFIDFATKRWAEHPGMHVYHFGAYEPSALKRLCARHETRREDLDRFLRGGRFIDLHTVVKESMRIGIERYGLKELEAMHDFKRAQDLAEAGISRRDVELALELADHGAITADLRNRVARYNAEDCLSTEALRTWLEVRRSQRIGEGVMIERPPVTPPEPSVEVGDRDRRIQALKDALTAKLPEDPAAWSDEHRAIALLASMLGYFRQEEKNAWWEHYRLRDLPVDEWLGERQMLAGLEFVEAVPKAKNQRNERRRYRFPPQEYSIKPGEKAFFTQHEDPAGLEGNATSLKVEELDADSRTVVLSSGGFAGRDPTAVFAEQVVGAKALEAALLAFAEHVLEYGLDDADAFAASRALLLRRSPKPAPGSDTLIAAGETAQQAAIRLASMLDRQILPVQGPPGTGKTYTGARVILDLVRQGKRVGVTAVSHKVIDNLLGAIAKAADKPVRLVHKEDGDAPPGIEYVDDSKGAFAAIGANTVVGGTVWLWADDRAAGMLDYLFIDEAGQMALAPALAASRAARNIVLLGDPQQLEQPQRGAHPEGADVAALVHVAAGRKTLAPDQGLFLDTTYRLHPTICAFTSELYYEGRLLSASGLEHQRARQNMAGCYLVDVAHEGNQAVAPEEVEAIDRIVRDLLQAGTTWTDRNAVTRPLAPKDILVIAPYNAQVSALREKLAPLGVTAVGTVDKFQGQEAPVVIYSCTSSSVDDAPRGMAFLYDPHRFNVATSRAQGVVVVVASPRLFEPDCRTPEQMRWANGLCRYREVATKLAI